MTTASYATPLELVRFLNIEQTVPAREPAGAARLKEYIGTGDGATTEFYLDNAYIIDDTYTIYRSNATGTAALTEPTDYSINIDNGVLTLSGTGVTSVATATLYGIYSYCTVHVTNTQLQEALNRAQDEIDEKTQSHWADGSTATPTYTQVTNEKHAGQGKTNRDYYLEHFPLPDVSTTNVGTVTAGTAIIEVSSTDGFPSLGYVSIEDDKIQYTSKTGTAFKGCTSVSAHNADLTVYPYVIEVSTTDSGTEPTWTVLQNGSEYDLDLSTGKVHVYVDKYDQAVYSRMYPPSLIPNRFRATYIYGYDKISDKVKRLCLLVSAKELIFITNNRSLIDGRNVDKMENSKLNDEWIENLYGLLDNPRTSNI